MTKWASNSDEILKQIDPKERAQSTVTFGEEEALKALGMSWETQKDHFYFEIAGKISKGKDHETKEVFLALLQKFLTQWVLYHHTF